MGENVIWVRTPKCAGNSMTSALCPNHLEVHQRQRAEGRSYVPLKWPNSCDFYIIVPGWKVGQFQNTHPEVFKNSWKYAFVRNPYDRVVSSYSYSLEKKWIGEGTLIGQQTFEEFVDNLMIKWPTSDQRDPLYAIYEHSYPLTKHLSDKDGKYDYLDSIFRVENLQEDFNKVCSKIGIPSIKLGHENKTDHKFYREYYKNDKTIEKVSKYFKEDINHFGYKF